MIDDTKQILKNSSRSKTSVNKDILLDVDIESSEKKFPSDIISGNIDQYKQYIKENNASNKYRLTFTINSLCSNVLYNHLSEITAYSGGTLYFYGNTSASTITNENTYVNYKYGSGGATGVTRETLVRDTGYSHPECGNFEYRCGIDIFNNHRFRNKEFVTVNKRIPTLNPNFGKNVYYNTINDSVRDYDGSEIKIPTNSGTSQTLCHLYYKDTFKSFIESIQDNLEEKNGWFGFTNPTSIDVLNFTSNTTINKAINNEPACGFVDLYPGRKEFTFIPQKNKLKKRIEKNWEYCLTYPAESYYDNELIQFGNNKEVNGILCDFCNSNGKIIRDNVLNTLIGNGGTDDFENIVIRTRIKNNIKDSDYVVLHLTNGEDYYTIKSNIKVKNIGIGGYGTLYYFSVNRADIKSGLLTLRKMGESAVTVNCYVQRVANGRPCKYYFRKFRRLPNFKNTSINNINDITIEDIENNCFNGFNDLINKLGFGVNIYGDRMAQIMFGDDIDVTGIRDNLGRELHEIFLTLIKTNYGHNEWYNEDPNYSSDTIEISHCFGEVSSGIEMPWTEDELFSEEDIYNVHKIHNVSGGTNNYNISATPLEKNLNCSGETGNSGETCNGLFMGDIVELDELNVEEYVLEDVCHRFNTAQREDMTGEYSAMTYDEIATDDYDSEGFAITTNNFMEEGMANIAPEGYYYKAHYNIPLRMFSDIVNEGQHTIINFEKLSYDDDDENVYSGTTDKNYYFENGGKILIYNKKEPTKKYIGTITNVTGDDFRDIVFTVNDEVAINVNNYNFFKPNSEKPSTAYDFDDGSGIYRWREIESCEFIPSDSELYNIVFTNGAHYIHKNINFFLRRQDPLGLYGLNPIFNPSHSYNEQLLEQYGKEKDTSEAEYFGGDIQIC